MKENTKKSIKIAGLCFASLAAVFMIVMMFVLLSFFGAFGYDVQSLTMSYEELRSLQVEPPLVKQPEGVFRANAFTVYVDPVSNSHDIENGKAACGAYSWETPLDFFCVAKKDGNYALHFNIDQTGKKVGSCALGNIFGFEERGISTYYTEKDGIRYIYVPFNRTDTETMVTPASVTRIFDEIFVF